VPADGTVVRGSSSVDESAVTGEAVPVLKQPGDSVIGGTVNGLGTFDMLVTRAEKTLPSHKSCAWSRRRRRPWRPFGPLLIR
jgi:P-type E1-E2 ATPase